MRNAAARLVQPSNPLRIVDGVDYPNTTSGQETCANKTGGLTGAADSRKGILSLWWRIDGSTSGGRQDCFHASGDGINDYIALFRSTGSKLQLNVVQVGGGPPPPTAVSIATSSSVYTDTASGWRHILISWDVTASAAHFYVDGADDKGTTTLNNVDLDYTINEWTIGGSFGSAPANGINGALAEVYFAPGQFLDFSLPYNRLKFRSASGKPVHLGTDGSLPTGTAPLIYLHLDDGETVANIATNRGTGGNFTNLTRTPPGAAATASTSPSD